MDTSHTPIPVYEVMTAFNQRSTNGRAVINPPERMAPLRVHKTGEHWYFCRICGRTTLDQNKHVLHMKDHEASLTANPCQYQKQSPTPPSSRYRIGSSGINIEGNGSRNEATDSEDDHDLFHPQTGTQDQTEEGICCKLCNRTFSKSSSFRVHMTNDHADDPDHTQCKFCDQVYHNSYMKIHVERNHHPDNQSSCAYCNTRVINKAALQRHIATYHPDTFVPSRPGRRISKYPSDDSSTSDELTSSIQSIPLEQNNEHETDADLPLDNNVLYRCKKCQKSFLSLASLRKHFSVHSEPQPQGKSSNKKCKLCFRTFGKMNLQKHMQVAHTNGPYQCPYCPCRFEFPKGIQTHIHMRHSDKGHSGSS